jgi:hypothetical protein
MLTWKEVIRPATYWHQSPVTGKAERLPVDDAYVRYLNDQTNAMRKAGLSIPIPLEHQPDARPLSSAEKAAANLRNNAGWVMQSRMVGDKMYALCDIQDAEIYNKLPKTIKYTSPWLTSFIDGNGKEWKGVMGHLALTSRPRIVNQEPFSDVAMALTSATSDMRLIPENIPAAGIFVPRSGMLTKTATGWEPRYSAAFSVLTNGAKFDIGDLEQKGKQPPPKDKGDDKDGDKTPPEKKEDGEETDNIQDDMEMTLLDIFCDVVEALFDIQMPEGCTEENVKDHFLKAMVEREKGKNVTDNPGNNPSQKPTPTVETPPMYMSLLSMTQDQAKAHLATITDPEKKQMAEAFLSLRDQRESDQKQTAALRKTYLDAGIARRQQRIERLSKCVNKQSLDKLLAMAASPGAALSLTDEGKISDPLESMLDILESSLKELPPILLNPTLSMEQKHPSDPNGAVIRDEEHRKRVVADFTGNR